MIDHEELVDVVDGGRVDVFGFGVFGGGGGTIGVHREIGVHLVDGGKIAEPGWEFCIEGRDSGGEGDVGIGIVLGMVAPAPADLLLSSPETSAEGNDGSDDGVCLPVAWAVPYWSWGRFCAELVDREEEDEMAKKGVAVVEKSETGVREMRHGWRRIHWLSQQPWPRSKERLV